MSDALPTVLVLDDEDFVRLNLRVWLEDDGFEALAAASAEEALETLAGRRADAAVVDIRLPGMDGSAFIERAAALYPDMRFLIHTGSADYFPTDSLRGLGIGLEHVHVKPVRDMGVLSKALLNLVAKADREPGNGEGPHAGRV